MSERCWQPRFTFGGRQGKDSQVRWLNTMSACCKKVCSALAPFEFLCGGRLAMSFKRPFPVAHRRGQCKTRKQKQPLLGWSRAFMFSFSRLTGFVPKVSLGGVRFRSQLAPRRVQNVKRHKGRIPIPTGGSTRGTTLAFGEWGIRIKGMGVRFSAKQLMTAEEVIKRKIKVVKGAKVYLRVFPDIPVCIKVRRTSRNRLISDAHEYCTG